MDESDSDPVKVTQRHVFLPGHAFSLQPVPIRMATMHIESMLTHWAKKEKRRGYYFPFLPPGVSPLCRIVTDKPPARPRLLHPVLAAQLQRTLYAVPAQINRVSEEIVPRGGRYLPPAECCRADKTARVYALLNHSLLV